MTDDAGMEWNGVQVSVVQSLFPSVVVVVVIVVYV
jgi:hypothetical protein